MNKPALLVCGSLALSLLAACSSAPTGSKNLSLGMTKDQVTKVMGTDYEPVAAREDLNSQQVEVIRFRDEKQGELLVYFRDGRLVQWGDTRKLDPLAN